jgi:Arc-like DNA binding domain
MLVDRKDFLRNMLRGPIGRSSGAMPKAKSAKGGKLHPLNMRTTQEVREWIERSAAASGRSLSAEVEARLERSFIEEQIIGGRRLSWLAHVMAMQFATAAMTRALAKGLGPIEGDAWLDDPDCYKAGMYAAFDVLLAGLSGVDPAAKVAPEIAAFRDRVLTWTPEKEKDK